MTFRELYVGQSFDWIDDANPSHVSFWGRCEKKSERTYTRWGHSTPVYRVGTINATVFHVGPP